MPAPVGEVATADPQPSPAIAPKTVGIIYPPPDLRSIVDKTAQFVARNGDEFEARIQANQANNPKFNFMKPQDPYHAYYRSKVKDFREGRAQLSDTTTVTAPKTTAPTPFTAAPAAPTKITPVVKKIVPTVPPPPLEFLSRPPDSLTSLDLDIIKLTAQFVARNGKYFLAALTTREVRNPQFDFLKPTNSVFPYFMSLVEAYGKVIVPSKAMRERLTQQTETTVLERCMYRAEWEKNQEEEQRKAAAAQDQERLAMQMIDWNDFVVVEAIQFAPEEEDALPPPLTEDDLKAFSKSVALEFREEKPAAVQEEMEVDMDMDATPAPANLPVPHVPMGAPGTTPSAPAIPPPPVPVHAPPPVPSAPAAPVVEIIQSADDDTEMKIVRNYRPGDDIRATDKRAARAVKYQVCPRCQQEIPVDEMEQHMRIELLHPDYLEKKKQAAQRPQTVPFAENEAIGEHLKRLAQRRTDLFGGDEEVEMGQTLDGDQDGAARDKAIWDGHANTAQRVMAAAQSLPQQPAPVPAQSSVPAAGPYLPGQAPPPPPAPRAAPSSLPVAGMVAPSAMPHLPQPPPPGPPGAARPGMLPTPPMPTAAAPAPPGVAPSMPAPPGTGQPYMPAPGAPQHVAPAPTAQPEAKRQRVEPDASMSMFIPEQTWLARYAGPVAINVSVPNDADHADWNFNGQMLNLTVPLTITVATLKEQLSQQLGGMPASKQKLRVEGPAGFLKDAMTLAAYNIAPNTLIQLSSKERGGRGKK